MKLYKKDKGNVFITASLESSEQGEHGLQESSSARLDSRKPHPSATLHVIPGLTRNPVTLPPHHVIRA